MIYSMTGFATSLVKSPWGNLRFECRSVNHRYLDLNFKLPDQFLSLESNLREIARKELNRGKLDCFLRFEESADSATWKNLTLDMPLIESLLEKAHQVGDKIVSETKRISETKMAVSMISPFDVLRWPKVVRMAEMDMSKMNDIIQSEFKELLTSLLKERSREGATLKVLIEERAQEIKVIIQRLKARVPAYLEEYRERLVSKLQVLKNELDENRLEQEMVYLAQKWDVSEELDRLTTHVDAMETLLKQGGVVGRRLDFLLQELNREANTLSSKSLDSQISLASVDLKVLIEQIREQVQNIE